MHLPKCCTPPRQPAFLFLVLLLHLPMHNNPCASQALFLVSTSEPWHCAHDSPVISLHKALRPCTTLLPSKVTHRAKVPPHDALVLHGLCQGANRLHDMWWYATHGHNGMGHDADFPLDNDTRLQCLVQGSLKSHGRNAMFCCLDGMWRCNNNEANSRHNVGCYVQGRNALCMDKGSWMQCHDSLH